MRHIIALAATGVLGGCVHGPAAPASAADFTPVVVTAAPNASYYADCIAQAAERKAYGRAHDDEAELVLFSCTEAPARAFYDGLGAHSARVGSEIVRDGRTYRSTNPVRADLFGVDYCWTDGARYECLISLRAGEFIRP